ncbi:hypothetical protein [Amycolatopsis sp. NPDC021455]|uniref:WXG100 family type VII secretion target n=1 Tax=Amycolatopsis sp. NPDC021455 TaxID=3154901 RepID=UPI0033E8C55A
MTAAGYRVAPARLDKAAGEFGARADVLTPVQSALAASKLPATAFGQVSESASAAKTYEKTMTELATDLETHLTRLHKIQSGLTTSAAGYRTTDAQVAAMYRALIPALSSPKR